MYGETDVRPLTSESRPLQWGPIKERGSSSSRSDERAYLGTGLDVPPACTGGSSLMYFLYCQAIRSSGCSFPPSSSATEPLDCRSFGLVRNLYDASTLVAPKFMVI
ncbi:hypothetical protein Vafri_528 [Volvox africanus]|nr:hypothetical protein Vafri_528 [Volvox africanus]